MSKITIEIEDLKKVKIEPDECLLFKLNEDFAIDDMAQVADALEQALPKGINYLVYSENIGKFQVVKQL